MGTSTSPVPVTSPRHIPVSKETVINTETVYNPVHNTNDYEKGMPQLNEESLGVRNIHNM